MVHPNFILYFSPLIHVFSLCFSFYFSFLSVLNLYRKHKLDFSFIYKVKFSLPHSLHLSFSYRRECLNKFEKLKNICLCFSFLLLYWFDSENKHLSCTENWNNEHIHTISNAFFSSKCFFPLVTLLLTKITHKKSIKEAEIFLLLIFFMLFQQHFSHSIFIHSMSYKLFMTDRTEKFIFFCFCSYTHKPNTHIARKKKMNTVADEDRTELE